jgi:hypothetical protein
VTYNQNAKINSEVLGYVRNHNVIAYKMLWRHFYTIMSEKDFVEAVKAALVAGYITIEVQAGEKVIRYVHGAQDVEPYQVDQKPPASSGS